MIPTRAFDRWGGALLTALGVVGLFAGVRIVVLNSEPLRDLILIGAGVLLLWAGGRGTDGQALAWTRLLGGAFLVLGVGALVNPDLFGVFTYRLSGADTLLHLLTGAAGIGSGWRTAVPAG